MLALDTQAPSLVHGHIVIVIGKYKQNGVNNRYLSIIRHVRV